MTTDIDAKKRQAALAALALVEAGATIGVGTGSTVNLFIEALAQHPGGYDGGLQLRGQQCEAARGGRSGPGPQRGRRP